ncbi:MAG: formate--tetrahydrofolate ligase [Thermoproteota archaeon]
MEKEALIMPVKKSWPMQSDIEIAYKTELYPIKNVAEHIGILEEELEHYGKYVAKVNYRSILNRLKGKPRGKLIIVTAITPTPLGEGKTTVSIGLGQAFYERGLKVINTLREPSKGVTFGIKGGATGGGYSQVLPMDRINLNFTGDIPAVELAHNLCAAAVDASILHGNPLNIDLLSIEWPYCMDVEARALRRAVIGLGGRSNGYPREARWSITVATETAAIHALTTGLEDLRKRLGRAVVAYTYSRKPVTCEELGVAGAMAALLVEAIKPNLVQSTEGHPVLVHGFPFANIAHGTNSIIATLVALRLADYVICETGFSSECGFSKFCDIVCRQSPEIRPDCAVIVCTVRALKEHGGAFLLRPGMSYKKVRRTAETENLQAVENGCENLAKHIEIVNKYGIPAVVAINRFTTDTDREIRLIYEKAIEAGAEGVAVVDPWSKGGEGCQELMDKVLEAMKKPHELRFLYPDEATIKEKIETLATELYGADDVKYSSEAEEKIEFYESLGYDRFPINMAKTHLSLSHNSLWKNVPKNYTLPVDDISAFVGAGFLVPVCGEMQLMPGLPRKPAFLRIDVETETGKVRGLF